MKFFAFLTLLVAASAQPAQDRSDRFLIGVISSILEALQKPPADFGPAIIEEPISVGPGIVDSLVPIAVGPAIVDNLVPIAVGPAIVDDVAPISVGPAIVDSIETSPAADPSPAPIPSIPWFDGSSPLVQLIVNVNGAQSGSIVGSPVAVEGLPSPIEPTPVVVVEPIDPTPVLVEEIVPEPVAILPEELN